MEVLRRSSVFAAEFMDAFDRSPTDKELVAQAKALGREFVHARLLRAGLAWSAPERAAPAPGGRLTEVCAVLLRLGECGARAGGVRRLPSEPRRTGPHPETRGDTLRCWVSLPPGQRGPASGSPEWPRAQGRPDPGRCSPCSPASGSLHTRRRPPQICLLSPDLRHSGDNR